MKFSACGVTRFLRCDGTTQAELRVGTKICGLLSGRSFAEIDVLMPARNAQRNAAVELILAGVDAVGIHGSDKLVSAVSGLLVEQRSRLRWIEVEAGLESVVVPGEVILG